MKDEHELQKKNITARDTSSLYITVQSTSYEENEMEGYTK